MEALVYTYFGEQFSLAQESVATRAGYLLAGSCTNVGKKSIYLSMAANPSKLTRKDRLWLMEGIHKDGEGREVLDRLKRIFKTDNTIKHKTKEQILAVRNSDEILKRLTNDFLKDLEQLYAAAGLLDMIQLEETGIFEFILFGYLYDINGKPTSIEASDFLQFNMPGHDLSQGIICLPNEFFEEAFVEITTRCKEAEHAGNFYLEHCLELPNINLLQAAELKAVRKSLLEPGRNFRTAADEWIKCCHSNADKQQRKNLFYQEVLPVMAPLRDALSTNEIFHSCANLRNFNLRVNVFMGELPVALVWDFYRHFGAIPDKDWEILQEKGIPASGSWPVMIVSVPTRPVEPVPDTGEADEPVSVKKSIQID